LFQLFASLQAGPMNSGGPDQPAPFWRPQMIPLSPRPQKSIRPSPSMSACLIVE
jgi:hypothetical protein